MGLSLYYTCFYILPKDIKEYEKEIKKSEQKRAREKTSSPCDQERARVKKEIWSPCDEHRLYTLITAASSKLHIERHCGKIELKEDLQDVFCLIQDKIYQTTNAELMQNLKTLTCPGGVYDYSEKSFRSGKVVMGLYTLAGSTPPLEIALIPPQMKGFAKKTTLSFKDHLLFFKAEAFSADVMTKEALNKNI